MKINPRYLASFVVVLGLLGCSSSDASSPGAAGSSGASGAAGASGGSAGSGGSEAKAGSGGSNAGGSGGDGVAGTVGMAGTGGVAGVVDCNELANEATVVTGTSSNDPAPTMTGGTIVDGTYLLTTDVTYSGGGADDKTHKRTITITGTTLQIVNSDNGGAEVHVTATLAPSGIQLNEVDTCPAGLGAAKPTDYTATATTLTTQVHGDNQVETYEKQ